MANEREETKGYDLGSTGTIVEIDARGGSSLSWFIDATGSADFVVEIRGDAVGWKQIDSYSSVTSVDDGLVAAEAVKARVENTSTNSGETADALMGIS